SKKRKWPSDGPGVTGAGRGRGDASVPPTPHPPPPLRFYHGIAVPGGCGGWGNGVVANQVANDEGGETYDKVQNMVGDVDVCQAEEQAIVMTKGAWREVESWDETQEP